MNIPLLSILIATKNRIPYCIQVIETILQNAYINFELVVHDNSDTLGLKEYISARVKDKRLVYKYQSPPFSSIDNFNAVIGLAKGDYLCLIGDDDAVHPEIFKAIEWAKGNKISAIVPKVKVIYRWPDACDNIDDNGVLSVGYYNGRIARRSTKNCIKTLMRNGGQNYLNLPFPKLYHGIVKRQYLEQIKLETGQFVGGLSPDIYIAIGLAKFIPEIVEIDFPLTLPGICGKSTPMDEKRNRYEKLEDAPHFRDRGEYLWAPEVPRFYSGYNIWADSALAAIRDLKLTKYLKYFNRYKLGFILEKNHAEKINEVSFYLNKNKSLKHYCLYKIQKQLFKLHEFLDRWSFQYIYQRIKLLIENKNLTIDIKNCNSIKKAITIMIDRQDSLIRYRKFKFK